MYTHRAVEGEVPGDRLQGQAAVVHLVVGSRQLAVIHGQRQQFQLLAVQHQRRQVIAELRVAANDQLGMDQAVVLVQLEGQVGLFDQVVGGLIVLEVYDFRLLGAHGRLFDCKAAP
ncbi:hypothetical protein D3C71_1945620 [compost metagenome]